MVRTFKYRDIPLNFAKRVKKRLKTISLNNIGTRMYKSLPDALYTMAFVGQLTGSMKA